MKLWVKKFHCRHNIPKNSGQASEYIAGVYDHVCMVWKKIKTKQNIELFLEFLEKMFQTVHTIVSKKTDPVGIA